jgi:hypothetical protein
MDSTMIQFELRFQSLNDQSRGFAFPCDPRGLVNMDQLSDRTQQLSLRTRHGRPGTGGAGGAACQHALSANRSRAMARQQATSRDYRMRRSHRSRLQGPPPASAK